MMYGKILKAAFILMYESGGPSGSQGGKANNLLCHLRDCHRSAGCPAYAEDLELATDLPSRQLVYVC